eukprot:COSAG01_NODE_1169_length_11408_cov_35.108056_9_plen_221_part_00
MDVAQRELAEAEQRRHESELDVILSLRPLGAGAGGAAAGVASDPEPGCGRLVTVSFGGGGGGGGRADGALAALGPEPECEPAASSAVANRARNFVPYCCECLSEQSFAVVDAFVGEHLCAAVREEIVRLDREGRLHHGLLGGGATGTAPTQTNRAMRGDRVGWFDGHEPQIGLRALPTYLQAVDALVGLVAGTLPELQALQVERRAPMVRVRAGSPLVVE